MSKPFDLDPKIENADIGTKKLSSISNQRIKGVHPDFLTVAEAMTSAFSAIEKNQSWDLCLLWFLSWHFVFTCSRGN